MTVAATIAEAIEQIAKSGFATVTVGGQTVTVKSIKELIEADQYIKAQAASTSTRFGLRTKTIKPYYP